MRVDDAQRKAAMLPGCKGFCFKGASSGGLVEICFKDKWDITAGEDWTSFRIETGCQRVSVHRLTSSIGGRGWKYHDRRTLELSAGELHIFEKGSSSKVKWAMDVATGVEECVLMPGGVVSLLLRMLPSGADRDDGVLEHKPYVFEFPTARLAANFHQEVNMQMHVER